MCLRTENLIKHIKQNVEEYITQCNLTTVGNYLHKYGNNLNTSLTDFSCY
jgi:hypothetical protein